MKLTILGTGNALVTECYNTCFALSNENGEVFLVDGGGGSTILHQLKHAGFSYGDIRHIFVTHKHIDHILGVIWMIRVLCQQMNKGLYQGNAYIYSHEEVIGLLTDMAGKLLQTKETACLGKRLFFVTVTDGETKTILDKPVTFFDIHSTKAKQFGFSMQLNERDKLTCCGDEPYSDWERTYAQDSKWLLHEAFCLYGEADRFKPYEKHHSTVKDACELAESLHVKNLVLYHTEDKNISERKTLYRAEGQQYFHGNLLIPDDMEVIQL